MAFSKEELKKHKKQSNKSEHKAESKVAEPKNKKPLFISIFSLIVIIIIAGISFSAIQANKPGPLDDFAKCLTDKGAVMYGASFCKYSAAQKTMFGKSFKHINYRDFSENPEVKLTPTWFINGEKFERVQSLDKLALETGCSLG